MIFKRYIVFIVISMFYSVAANAEVLVVNTFSDQHDGVCNQHCSLRDAITQANQTPEKDTVQLQEGRYLIEISNIDEDGENYSENQNLKGDFDILNPIEITGKGEALTIIDGNRKDGVFNIRAGGVSIRGLTIANGYSFNGGAGGLTNAGELTLHDVTIRDNEKESDCAAQGGGIYNYGTLRMYSSKVQHNIAKDYCELTRGGGVFNRGVLEVRDSFFSGNVVSSHELSGKGGAIYNEGEADVRRSSFYRNKVDAAGQGGAIFNSGTFKLVSSTVFDNESGRAIPGGAVANGSYKSSRNDMDGGELSLTNVTVYANKNYGLYSNGDTYLHNSIVVGNFFHDGEHYFVDPWYQDCYQNAGQFVSNNNLFSKNAVRGCNSEGSLYWTELSGYLFESPVVTDSEVYIPLKQGAIIRGEAELCPQYDQLGNQPLQSGSCDLGAIQYLAPSNI